MFNVELGTPYVISTMINRFIPVLISSNDSNPVNNIFLTINVKQEFHKSEIKAPFFLPSY